MSQIHALVSTEPPSCTALAVLHNHARPKRRNLERSAIPVTGSSRVSPSPTPLTCEPESPPYWVALFAIAVLLLVSAVLIYGQQAAIAEMPICLGLVVRLVKTITGRPDRK